MMLKKAWISQLVIILLFVSFHGNCQNKVPVSFDFPYGNKYEIRINEYDIYTKRKINLPAGSHQVEIWVPGLLLIIDTIDVKLGSENKFIYKNKTRPEYFGYARELKHYNFRKGLAISSVSLTSLSILGSVFTYMKANRLKNEYVATKSEYSSATDPFFFGTLERKLNDISRKYNRTRGVFYSSLAFSVAVWPAISFLTIQHFLMLKKPIFKFMNNPFRSKQTSMSVGFSLNSINLTLNL